MAKTDKQFELDFDQLPTTTVHQARLQMFEPSRRPKNATREITTAWGSAVVTGKLGQGHADVIEAIFSQAMDWKHLDDGRIQILVDPYKVRTVSAGGKVSSGEQLRKQLTEIMAAVIDLRIPARKLRVMGHIIDEVVEAEGVTKSDPRGGERKMWRVTVSRSFVSLLGGDLHIHYDPTPIAALTTGIAQAVARHVATHKMQPPGGWHIDGLIEAVGGGVNPKQMRNQRADLKADAKGLADIGLIIDGGRLVRHKEDGSTSE